MLSRLGFALRETGQALDRLGCRLRGSEVYLEEIYRHRTFQPVASSMPSSAAAAFVAPSATVAGDVRLGDRASVWFGAVIRGDGAPVVVGDGTNIQDGATVRTTPEDIGTPSPSSSSSGRGGSPPTTLGARVTVGHNASIGAGVTVGDEALIGMGATLGDGAVVEAGAMVAAGAAVPAGTVVPSGELWGGVPARRLRALKPEEAAFLPVSASKYAELAAGYAKEGLGA